MTSVVNLGSGALSESFPYTPRLHLERYGVIAGILAALSFLPRAWHCISMRQIGATYTFHIFDRLGSAVGINRAELSYPVTAQDVGLLRDPLLRLEDRRFFQHSGIDFRAIFRACLANLRAGRVVQGGGTITQQLIRNSLLTPHRSLLRKLLELALSWKLERHYSKAEILKLYSECVYLGNRARGFASASRLLFRRPLSRLTQSELAGLLGLLRSPARYCPIARPTAFSERANFIQRVVGGSAIPTFRVAVTNPIKPNYLSKPRLASLIRAELAQRGVNEAPSRVTTTIETTLQRHLDRALKNASHSRAIKTCAALIVSNRNLEVLAEAAWRDGGELHFSPSYFGAIQPGSVFKTITLLSALEQRIPLDRILESRPFVSARFRSVKGRPWEVRNYGHHYRGEITVLDAFKHSDNTAFARLFELLDTDQVYSTYERLGLCKAGDASPSIVLGGIPRGVSLRQLVETYAAIARDGWLQKVSTIREAGFYGQPATVFPAFEATKLIDPDVCQQLGMALFGAGRVIAGKQIAGKTGTTERGNVFVGYTEDVSMAVWVGFRRAVPEYARKTGAAVRLLDSVADYLFGATGASLKI